MEARELQRIIEAMIFVSEEPITEKSMLLALEPSGVQRELVRQTLDAVRAEWNDNPQRGMQLVEVAGGFQFRTKEACAEWLRLLDVPKPTRLSSPALEVLSIIAYRQPCARAEIEEVRGVDSGGVLKKLLERHLIKIVGRREEAGQPLIYGTTREFLELFNLKGLGDLPTLKDIQELMEQRRVQTDAARIATQSQNLLPLAGDGEDADDADDFDDEELTEVIPGDDDEVEESTEVIRQSANDEMEDELALDELERRMKDVTRLERAVFPKETLVWGDDGGAAAGSEATPGVEAGQHASSETESRETGA